MLRYIVLTLASVEKAAVTQNQSVEILKTRKFQLEEFIF